MTRRPLMQAPGAARAGAGPAHALASPEKEKERYPLWTVPEEWRACLMAPQQDGKRGISVWNSFRKAHKEARQNTNETCTLEDLKQEYWLWPKGGRPWPEPGVSTVTLDEEGYPASSALVEKHNEAVRSGRASMGARTRWVSPVALSFVATSFS